MAVTRNHLAFLDHAHEFDALQGDPGRGKGFKPHHRLNDPFDQSMILLNQIVQVLDLAYLDLLTGFLLECIDGCGIGATLVDRDLVR